MRKGPEGRKRGGMQPGSGSTRVAAKQETSRRCKVFAFASSGPQSSAPRWRSRLATLPNASQPPGPLLYNPI